MGRETLMNSKFQKALAVLTLGTMCFSQFAFAASEAGTKSKKATSKASAKGQSTATAEELRQIKEMLQQQQQQIETLRQQMTQRDQQLQQAQQQLVTAQSAAQAAEQKAAAAETAANEQKASIEATQNDVNSVKGTLTESLLTMQDEQKKTGAIASTLGRFRWNGDVRVRFEDFFQDGTPNRYRPRIRLRVGAEGKLSEDFIAGMALASGNLNDPTSTNSTLGDSFQRKPVSIDRGYIIYNPSYFKPLSVTAGKFAYTWQRTPQTFDSDINPEGFSEKLSFNLKNKVVRNVSFIGLQLYLNETNNTSDNGTITTTGCTVPAGSNLPSALCNVSASGKLPKVSTDSWAYGGQMQAKLQLGNFWSLTPSYTILNFHAPNYIVNGYANLVQGTTGTQGSPSTTNVQTGIFAPNGMTNAICPQTINGLSVPAFCSQFLYSDIILNNQFKTWNEKLPFTLLGEYLENLNAASNNKHMYQVEASLGQTKNKGDYQFGYAFTREEQDAAIASWVESDQRFPTNVLQHRLFASFKIAPNTTIGYTQWIGRALNTNIKGISYSPLTVPGQHEPWLKRGQLDFIYTF